MSISCKDIDPEGVFATLAQYKLKRPVVNLLFNNEFLHNKLFCSVVNERHEDASVLVIFTLSFDSGDISELLTCDINSENIIDPDRLCLR